ncbi:MAG: Fe-S cluster assembly protein SufD [Planctomycetota bacterium]
MTQLQQLEFTAEGFNAFVECRGEPGWLVDLRREAFARAEQMDWPARRDEEWMRTDIRAFKLGKYPVPCCENEFSHDGVTNAHQLLDGVELGGRIETLDSHIVHSSLDNDLADKGVVFGGISELAEIHPDLIREHLFKVVDGSHDKFAAMHAAFFAGGQVLYVPRGVCLDRPIHIGSVMSHGGSDLTHTLIIVEENAEATVLHECNSIEATDGGVHIGAVELIQRGNSNLRYVNLQEWGHKAFHFAHQKAQVDRDASLQWTIAAMGSGLTKVNQEVDLVGRRAESQVNGVMFTEGRQHLAYHTQQHHVAPDCRSDFLYKAAQQDKSRTVWRGMIKVADGAQHTDGYQRNDNLVLSKTSRADSIPGLEIEADDVRCTHGSTTAKVDEEQIFYARCRGFTRKEATRMIVTGFFQQIFDRITIESVREALGAAIVRQVREYE